MSAKKSAKKTSAKTSTSALKKSRATGKSTRSSGAEVEQFPPDIYSAEEIQWLTEKTKAASGVRTRSGSGPVAVLLPGILGSSLGDKNRDIWLDLLSLPTGGIAKLRLPDAGKYGATGVKGMLYDVYRPLELALKAAGYETYLYAYDWRKSIPDLGKSLAAWLKANFPNRPVNLIAHSMGGLVSRASFPHLGGSVDLKAFVTVGTPLAGALSPLLVMRGLHDTAMMISKFDLCHNDKELSETFSTFPGLLGMLPRFSQEPDWFDLKNWPQDNGHPVSSMKEVLKTAAQVTTALGNPPQGCPYHAIFGDGLATFAGLKVDKGKFLFTVSFNGDGTFPHKPAIPSQAKTVHYVPQAAVPGLFGGNGNVAEHGKLCQRPIVADAVVALLKTGACSLPTKPNSPTNTWQLTEKQLRDQSGAIRSARAARGIDTTPATEQERREFGFNLLRISSSIPGDPSNENNNPAIVPPNASGAPEGAIDFPRVVISRGEEIAIDIELAHGDIRDTQSRVILLGQIQGLNPATAVTSLDEGMSGALCRILEQRSTARGAGEVTIIPTGRHPVMAELIAVLDLGQWDLLNENALSAATGSAMRHILASRFDEFSTVLLGGARPDRPEIDIPFAIKHSFVGFIQALRDDPDRDRFRRIILVETNESRIREIRHELQGLLTSDPAFAGVRVTLSGSKLPAVRDPREQETRGATAKAGESSMLLLTSRAKEGGEHIELDGILKPRADSAAAICRSSVQFSRDQLQSLYQHAGVTTRSGVTTLPQLKQVTDDVTSLIPPELLAELAKAADSRIELVHDAEASRIPWEAMMLPNGTYPALKGGFSRRFVSANARVVWSSPQADKLRVLLVIDPTSNLPGARKEGNKLKTLLEENRRVDVTYLEGPAANAKDLQDILEKQVFDIFHYAGHSAFNRNNAAQSGLLLTGDVFFTSEDVMKLSRFPGVTIFNSCESAGIRSSSPKPQGANDAEIKAQERRDAARSALSVAEAFLIAGVRHYVGTFWPVSDDAATLFTSTLYGQLANGIPIGNAVRSARIALEKEKQPDWANYIHFGSPDAVIFSKNGAAT